MESEKPDKGANNDDADSIKQERVIGDDKANSDMVALYNTSNGYEEGNNERNPQDGTGYEQFRHGIKDEIATGVPVRSALDKTIFINRSGLRQTMESARATAPAASSRKSRAAQTPINALETILSDY